MPKKNIEIFDFEAIFHLSLHFFGILLLFCAALYLPIPWAVAILILEILQMKYFGRCVLTVYAHKRGYMKGLTYWQYISMILGIDDYKRADKLISRTISLSIFGILAFRFLYEIVR